MCARTSRASFHVDPSRWPLLLTPPTANDGWLSSCAWFIVSDPVAPASIVVLGVERENTEDCRFENVESRHCWFENSFSIISDSLLCLQVINRRQHVQAARVDTKTLTLSYQRLFCFWNRCSSSDAPSSFSIKPFSGSRFQLSGGWVSLFQGVFIISDGR